MRRGGGGGGGGILFPSIAAFADYLLIAVTTNTESVINFILPEFITVICLGLEIIEFFSVSEKKLSKQPFYLLDFPYVTALFWRSATTPPH